VTDRSGIQAIVFDVGGVLLDMFAAHWRRNEELIDVLAGG
jgi:hypothetical protein